MMYIKIATGEYPLSIYQIRRQLTAVSLGLNPSDAELLTLGYAKVQETPKPVGEVVEESQPILEDGAWVQQWTVRTFTPEERKAYADQQRADALASGMPWTFNGVQEHVQIRERDLINLMAIRKRADVMIANDIEGTLKFRSQEDHNHYLTPEEVVAMTDAAFEFTYAIYDASWTLKDQA
jgi:hypothetical protein